MQEPLQMGSIDRPGRLLTLGLRSKSTSYCTELGTFLSIFFKLFLQLFYYTINSLTLNSHYSGLTALLASRRYILNIYSTNIRTEYFKRAA
jgi:hypothetical protein